MCVDTEWRLSDRNGFGATWPKGRAIMLLFGPHLRIQRSLHGSSPIVWSSPCLLFKRLKLSSLKLCIVLGPRRVPFEAIFSSKYPQQSKIASYLEVLRQVSSWNVELLSKCTTITFQACKTHLDVLQYNHEHFNLILCLRNPPLNMKNVSNFAQMCFTDTNQPEPTNLNHLKGLHRLHTSTVVTSSPLTCYADFITSAWHEAFWSVERKLKGAASTPQVGSNK